MFTITFKKRTDDVKCMIDFLDIEGEPYRALVGIFDRSEQFEMMNTIFQVVRGYRIAMGTIEDKDIKSPTDTGTLFNFLAAFNFETGNEILMDFDK